MRLTAQTVESFEDATLNFEQIQSILSNPQAEPLAYLQLLSAQRLQIAVGADAVTWPGAALASNMKTTAHGLGRIPRAYAVFSNGTTSATFQNFHCSGTNAGVGQSVSVDATSVYYRGWSLQANPNAGETGNVLWIAIG